jgi:hypothetical protein
MRAEGMTRLYSNLMKLQNENIKKLYYNYLINNIKSKLCINHRLLYI